MFGDNSEKVGGKYFFSEKIENREGFDKKERSCFANECSGVGYAVYS